MIVVYIIAAILVIMGILVLIGKGDHLIAGYNTASPEEKAQVHIKRLRGLIGGFVIVIAPLMCIFLREGTLAATWSFVALTTVLCIILLILANTWAKKKSK